MEILKNNKKLDNNTNNNNNNNSRIRNATKSSTTRSSSTYYTPEMKKYVRERVAKLIYQTYMLPDGGCTLTITKTQPSYYEIQSIICKYHQLGYTFVSYKNIQYYIRRLQQQQQQIILKKEKNNSKVTTTTTTTTTNISRSNINDSNHNSYNKNKLQQNRNTIHQQVPPLVLVIRVKPSTTQNLKTYHDFNENDHKMNYDDDDDNISSITEPDHGF